MAAKAVRKNGKYRVVDDQTRTLVKNLGDKPVDGGGHMTGTAAERQARAINWSKG